MIDIARAKLPGGDIGDYQMGREKSLSVVVLGAFGMSVQQFVELVRDAATDDEIAERLWSTASVPADALSARLSRVTVADVPEDLRPDFQRLYGGQPPTRLVFDVLEADDTRAFTQKA